MLNSLEVIVKKSIFHVSFYVEISAIFLVFRELLEGKWKYLGFDFKAGPSTFRVPDLSESSNHGPPDMGLDGIESRFEKLEEMMRGLATSVSAMSSRLPAPEPTLDDLTAELGLS